VRRRLRWEPEAEAELLEAARWYEAECGLGEDLLVAVDEAVDRLRGMPEAGLVLPGAPGDLALRRVLVRRFPYAVVYLITPEELAVLAVAHHSRRPDYWRSRI